MKKFFTILLSALTISAFAQQLTNGGFENWTGAKPDGWATSQSAAATKPDNTNRESKTTVTAEVYAGTSAIKLASGYSPFHNDTVSGQLQYGSGMYVALFDDLFYSGAPFALKPDSISFAYQYTSARSDSGLIQVILRKAANFRSFLSYTIKPSATYKKVTLPLTYTAGIYDTLDISAYSSYDYLGKVKSGSVLLLDEVKFIYNTQPSGLELLASTPYLRIYPNPAKAQLYVSIHENSIGNLLQIFDLKGREVKREILQLSTTVVDIALLPQGTYLYRVAGSNNETVVVGSLVKE